MSSDRKSLERQIKTLTSMYSELSESIDKRIENSNVGKKIGGIETKLIEFDRVKGNLNRQLEEINQKEKEIAGHVAKFQDAFTDISEIKSKTEELEGRLQTAESTIEPYDEMHSKHEKHIDTVDEKLRDLIAKLRQDQEEANENLKREMLQKIGKVKETFQTQFDELKEFISNQITEIRTELSTVDSRIENANNELAETMKKYIKRTEGKCNQYTNEQIAVVNETLTKHQEQIDKLKSDISEDVKDKLKDLDERTNSNGETITKLEEAVYTELSPKISDCQSKLSEFKKTINKKFQETDTAIEDLQQKTNNLEESLDKTKQELIEKEAEDNKNTNSRIDSLLSDVNSNKKEYDEFINDFNIWKEKTENHLKENDESISTIIKTSDKTIKKVKELISSTNSQFEAINNDLQTYIEANNTDKEQLKRDVTSSINTNTSKIDQTIEKVEMFKTSTSKTVESITNDINDIKEQVSAFTGEVRTDLSNYDKAMKEQRDDFDAKIESLKKDLGATIDGKIERTRNRIIKLEGTIAAITATDINGVVERLAALEKSTTETNNSVLENKLAAESAVKELTDNTAAQFKSISKKMNSGLEALKTELSESFESQLSSHKSEEDSEHAEIRKLVDANTTQILAANEVAEANKNELSEKIEKINSKLRSKIKEVKETSDEAKAGLETAKTNINDIQTNISKITDDWSKVEQKLRTDFQAGDSELQRLINENSAHDAKTFDSIQKLQQEFLATQSDVKVELESIKHELSDTKKAIDSSQEREDKRQVKVLAEVDRRIEAANSSVSDRITQVESIYNTVVGDSKVDIPHLVTELEGLKTEVSENKKAADNGITGLRTDLMGRLKDQRSENSSQHKAITESIEKLRSDSAEANRNTAQTLKDMISKNEEAQKKSSESIKERFNNLVGEEKSTLPEIVQSIAAIKTSVREKIKSNNAEVRDMLDEFGQAIDGLDARIVADKDARTSEMKTFKGEMQGMVNELKNEIAATDANQQKSIDEITTSLNTLRGKSTETIPSIVTSINGLNKSLAEVSEQAGEAQRVRMSNLMNALENAQKEIVSIRGGSKDSIADIKAQQASLKDSFEQTISSQTETITKYTDKLHKENKELSSRIHSAESSMTELDTRLTNAVNDCNSRIDTIESRVDGASKSIKSECEALINEQVAELTTAINDSHSSTHTRIKHVKSAINQLSERIDANTGDISSTRKAIKENEKNNKQDVERVTKELQSQITKTHESLVQSIQKGDSQLKNNIDLNNSNAEVAAKAAHEELSKRITNLSVMIESLVGPEKLTLGSLAASVKTIQEGFSSRISKNEDNIAKNKEDFTKIINDNQQRAIKEEEDLKKAIVALQKSNEESVAELKASDAKITEDFNEYIRNMKRSLSKDNKSTEAKLDTLRTEFDTYVESTKAKTEDYQKATGEELAAIKASVEETASDAKSAAKKAEANANKATTEAIGIVNTSISNLNGELQKQISKVDSDSRKRDEKLKEMIDSQVSGLDSSIKELAETMTALKSEAESIAATAKDFSRNTEAAIDHKLATMSSALEAANQQIAKNNSTQQAVNNSMKDIIEKVNNDTQKDFAEMARGFNAKLAKHESAALQRDGETRSLITAVDKKADDTIKSLQQISEDERKKTLAGEDAIRKEQSDAISKQQQAIDSMKKKVAELNQDITNAIRPAIEDARKHVKDANNRIGEVEVIVRNNNTETTKLLTETQAKVSEVETNANSAAANLRSSLDAEIEKRDNSNEGVKEDIKQLSSSSEQQRARIDAAEKELQKLQKIHHYNAEFEQFGHRFEQVLSYIEQMKADTMSLLVASMQDQPAPGADQEFAAASAMLSSKLPKMPPRSESSIVDLTEQDTEIGLLIRKELHTNASVIVRIPNGLRVAWDKQVRIGPYQSVKIDGGKDSMIMMKGAFKVANQRDPARAIVDSLGVLALRNLRIDASCGDCRSDRKGFSALFVATAMSAEGISSITIEGCSISTDRPVINAGASSFASVFLASTKIGCSTRDFSIYPVTAESGSMPKGWAALSLSKCKLSGGGIEWLEDPHIRPSADFEE